MLLPSWDEEKHSLSDRIKIRHEWWHNRRQVWVPCGSWSMCHLQACICSLLCLGGIQLHERTPTARFVYIPTTTLESKRRLESHEVDDISFVKDEHGKTKKAPQSMVYDPRPPELQKTTAQEKEISTLRDNTGIPSSFLHLLPLPNLTGASLNTGQH